MLHILWMILKIILIVIGILLGLVLLALLLVLFCPVRYRAEAEKASPSFKETRLEASVSWLFRLIWVKVLFQNGNLSPDIRIFGIPVLKLLKKKENSTKNSTPGRAPKQLPEKAMEEKTDTPEPEDKPGTPEPEEKPDIAKPDKSTELPAPDELRQISSEDSEEAGWEEPAEAKERFYRKLWNKIRSVWEKIIGIPQKIIETVRRITSSIRAVYDKIDWWKQFLTHPRTKAAVSCVKERVWRIIRHVFPTKVRGSITFGSENPSVTGTVLAVLGMTIPFHKNNVMVSPVFQGENILEGNVWLKGRIYGIVLVKAALEILFNKNVKYVINRWKKRKEG